MSGKIDWTEWLTAPAEPAKPRHTPEQEAAIDDALTAAIESVPGVRVVRPEPVDFREVGRKAFEAGEPAAAAMNRQVVDALAGLPVGSAEGAKILKDFSTGWQAANLAAPVDLESGR
jgi:hypothetical protein